MNPSILYVNKIFSDISKLRVHLPCAPIVSVRDKNVTLIRRLKNQLQKVDAPLPAPRAHRGYISALIVHGIGPIPTVT